MAETQQYDLIVVGGGSGLKVASFAANTLGWNVAVIDKGPLGGTCLNRGCIPSKIIIHAADIADEIRKAEAFGVRAEITGIDFAKVTNRANEFVDAEAEKIEQGIRKNEKLTFYNDTAEFVDDYTLTVGGETISGERILIAAGTRPFVPPIDGIEDVEYMTSKEALRQTTQPKSMVIIGGGYIATELGHFYGALGTEITVVEMSEKLVKREDKDVSDLFTRVFSGKHRVLTNSKVVAVEEENGMKRATIEDKEGNRQTVEAETLLVTTGRKSNADILKLENTNVSLDEKGHVQTNEYMETNVPNVWALGDIVGKAPFKHGANYEAKHIIKALGGDKMPVDYSVMPHAIFSTPQVAGVGLTEQEAEEKGLKYEVKRHDYIKTGMGKAIEAHDGFIKYIIDPEEDTILGCHIIGPHSSILIHEVVVAMSASGGKASALRDAIHIHPSLSEIVPWPL